MDIKILHDMLSEINKCTKYLTIIINPRQEVHETHAAIERAGSASRFYSWYGIVQDFLSHINLYYQL